MTDKISERFEFSSDNDKFYDFCLWEYAPISPVSGKFNPVNILLHSFYYSDMPEESYELIQTIRDGIGTFNTVWGIKNIANKIIWEFYFYDYARKDRVRSITGLLEIIRPFINCRIRANENLHYFMFSIDITKELVSGAEELDEIHMYIGNPGSNVSSGICYSLTEKYTRLENFYFFFDRQKEMEDITGKVVCSSTVDFSKVNIDEIIIPELRNCRVIVIANKQYNDSIYFSGIDVNQLLFFLKKMEYPDELILFIEQNRAKLDHLLYDVGFDYRMDGDNLKIIKSGYYGIF